LTLLAFAGYAFVWKTSLKDRAKHTAEFSETISNDVKKLFIAHQTLASDTANLEQSRNDGKEMGLIAHGQQDSRTANKNGNIAATEATLIHSSNHSSLSPKIEIQEVVVSKNWQVNNQPEERVEPVSHLKSTTVPLPQQVDQHDNFGTCPGVHRPRDVDVVYRHKYWQVLNDGLEDIVVYSAFYDNRPIVGHLPWIRIQGVRNLSTVSNQKLYCYVWYPAELSRRGR